MCIFTRQYARSQLTECFPPSVPPKTRTPFMTQEPPRCLGDVDHESKCPPSVQCSSTPSDEAETSRALFQRSASVFPSEESDLHAKRPFRFIHILYPPSADALPGTKSEDILGWSDVITTFIRFPHCSRIIGHTISRA